MEFTPAPSWQNKGVEPPAEQKEKGFSPGYKPPAAYFNWFWNTSGVCITELQQGFNELEEKIPQDIPGKSVAINHTMVATGWSDGTYTFTDERILADSYVEFAPQNTTTAEQITAIQKANIICKVQAAGSLTLQALGEVPSIDVPVVFIIRGDL